MTACSARQTYRMQPALHTSATTRPAYLSLCEDPGVKSTQLDTHNVNPLLLSDISDLKIAACKSKLQPPPSHTRLMPLLSGTAFCLEKLSMLPSS